MKNILVTGGAGYIGTTLSNFLIKKKKKVFVIDNLSTGSTKFLHKEVNFFNLDLCRTNEVKAIIRNNSIDTVFHLASKKSITESKKKPKFYKKEIFINTKNLYKICIKSNVKNFIFSSTAAVYGKKASGLFYENDKCIPISVYGNYKFKSENFLKKNSEKRRKIKITIFRFFNVVGSYNQISGQINFNDQSLFSNLCLAIKKKKIFHIFGNQFNTPDGTCLRDFIHITDLCRLMFDCVAKKKMRKSFNIYNLGYKRKNSVLDVIKSFQKISGKKIKYTFKRARSDEVFSAIASNCKIKKILPNFVFKFRTLNQMVKSHYKWYLKKNTTL